MISSKYVKHYLQPLTQPLFRYQRFTELLSHIIFRLHDIIIRNKTISTVLIPRVHFYSRLKLCHLHHFVHMQTDISRYIQIGVQCIEKFQNCRYLLLLIYNDGLPTRLSSHGGNHGDYGNYVYTVCQTIGCHCQSHCTTENYYRASYNLQVTSDRFH